MYKSGIGYNEIRAVQSQNLTHRFYDRLYGIRVNVVQVSFPLPFPSSCALLKNAKSWCILPFFYFSYFADGFDFSARRCDDSAQSHDCFWSPRCLFSGTFMRCSRVQNFN